MCPTHTGEFRAKSCEIYNSQTNQSIDLRTIFKDGSMKVNNANSIHTTFEFAKKLFLIHNYNLVPSISSQLNHLQITYANSIIDIDMCNNSKTVEFDYTQSAIKLFFDQKAPCGKDGKKMQTTICGFR